MRSSGDILKCRTTVSSDLMGSPSCFQDEPDYDHDQEEDEEHRGQLSSFHASPSASNSPLILP